MRRILTIAFATLMLTGCMADWKSPRTGSRWASGPDLAPTSDNGRTASANTSVSGPTGTIPNP
jgi:hypothetical protein